MLLEYKHSDAMTVFLITKMAARSLLLKVTENELIHTTGGMRRSWTGQGLIMSV